MIKWKLPTADTPGFLKRRRELSVLLDAEPTPKNLDKITDFLKDYVEDEKTLEDCSQVEYGHAIVTLMGYGSSVTSPKEGSSVPQ